MNLWGIATSFFAALAVFLNILLIVIIVFYVRTALGKYKWALVVLSVFEICFASTLIFAPPYFVITNTVWYSLSTETVFENKFIGEIGFIMYCSLHQTYVMYLAFLFVYRYLVICQNDLLERIRSSKLLTVLIVSLQPLHTLITFVCGLFLCGHEIMTPEHPIRNLAVDEIPNSADIASMSLKTLVSILGYANHVFVYYGTIPIFIVCGIRIWTTISRNQAERTSETIVEQKRLFYLILIQTITPLVLCNLPFLFLLTFPLWPHGFVFNSTSKLIPLVTVIPKIVDPIATIFFIPHYKKAAMKIFMTIFLNRHLTYLGTMNSTSSCPYEGSISCHTIPVLICLVMILLLAKILHYVIQKAKQAIRKRKEMELENWQLHYAALPTSPAPDSSFGVMAARSQQNSYRQLY